MTVHLSQLFITTEGLSLFLLEKHRQVSRQVPGDLRREGLDGHRIGLPPTGRRRGLAWWLLSGLPSTPEVGQR